ncbi:PREDICTED: uncharacterized protein LOC104734200 isoform X1 [Camelina sativa]|uniref:Uncharacterized protein LOC104734200 isoform X1 n=1 Tax=Camelina sativa TaxID=90675 RepID=A0ABM0V7C3_CAMSA|nr:PREDICTED: uncharacterized protein LOC104734200 isoform X1 [Camelina sativa]
MNFVVRRLGSVLPSLRHSGVSESRFFRTEAGQPRRRNKLPSLPFKKKEEKSEWWIVDGEMHEIGDHVPPRERFTIPRDNIPNKRRKQLREQFMRRTRLVLKEAEHEPWCKKYMELYNELRENWERLYWDEGYSKKIATDHANYESAEEDDEDFNPYRNRRSYTDQAKQEQGFNRSTQGDNWEKVNQIRDKFEFDRERRMRDKAFAPMNAAPASEVSKDLNWNAQRRPFDAERYTRY